MHFKSFRAVFITALLILSLFRYTRGTTIQIKGNKHLSKEFIISIIDTSDIYNSLNKSGYFEEIKIKDKLDTVYINVSEYPYIKEISINNNLIFPLTINSLSPFKNTVLNKVLLKDTLSSILNYYIYNGYPEVSFDTISVYDSTLHLHLYQGKIDSIRFFYSREKDNYIRKLLNIKEGDILDNFKIQSSISNLLHSGYFYNARYKITRGKRYFLDFFLLDAFPLIDTSNLNISFKSIGIKESGKLLSITNRFDNLTYSFNNNIYLDSAFHIDKWLFSASTEYLIFDTKYILGIENIFNHNYSTHIFKSGYKNKNLSIIAGAGYDFIRNCPSIMLQTKSILYNVSYNISYYRYLNSYLLLTALTTDYRISHNLALIFSGNYKYSTLFIPYTVSFSGFHYIIGKYSYSLYTKIAFNELKQSLSYKIGIFNNDLYQSIRIDYLNFSLSLSTRFTSGIEHHISLHYKSIIPF